MKILKQKFYTQAENIQLSESIRLGALLALAGGFMDAYSYIFRGHVFANAQTGNMLLIGVNLFEKNWMQALHYALPVAAFTTGIILSQIIHNSLKSKTGFFHWRQGVIILEIICISSVSIIPVELNLLANSLISAVCGMQADAFRKIHGNSMATTMCIGNLRSGTEYLYRFMHNRESSLFKKAILYFGLILCFIAGAVIGNYSLMYLKAMSILICSGILLTAFLLMCKKH